MSIILPVVFAVLLFFDSGERESREKKLYLVLSVIAVLSGIFAGFAAKSDHIGASLSGMISIFMR